MLLGSKEKIMEKVIIEVGSTNTKIDVYDGFRIKRLEEITILFKKHYKHTLKIDLLDIDVLVNKVNSLKSEYKDIFVCGTSIFRDLLISTKKEFLDTFKLRTGLDFIIISQDEENELTVLGATRAISFPVCIFVGGGGSTEISIYDKKIIESKNTAIGVIDVMEKFPDLADDFATTSLDDVMQFIEERLEVPLEKADTLILAGGGHEVFVRGSGIKYESNSLYSDDLAPIMMDIKTRIKETERFYREISLNDIKKKVANPDWWFATRAMCAFVLVVAKKIGAKYIVPTNISMTYGIVLRYK